MVILIAKDITGSAVLSLAHVVFRSKKVNPELGTPVAIEPEVRFSFTSGWQHASFCLINLPVLVDGKLVGQHEANHFMDQGVPDDSSWQTCP